MKVKEKVHFWEPRKVYNTFLGSKGGVGEIVPHDWGVLSERSERRRGACPPSGRKFALDLAAKKSFAEGKFS